ncbi:MAG: lipopolysaccharide transport periplasmic protein LptA [Sedimenticola sp.]|nr:MAG: lipopolysaccharide transport periplasmic protein LptA [Sedimenticola sp.]
MYGEDMRLNNTCNRNSWLFAALLLLNTTAFALESDKDQPIGIEADSVEIDDGTGQSIYKGNVILTQGSIRITASSITVTQTNGVTSKVVANGNPVTFKQDGDQGSGTIKGKAKQAEYLANSDTLFLIGDAELTQGKDSFKSDRITYDRAKAVVKAGASAKGKERVKVTIESKNGNTGNQ